MSGITLALIYYHPVVSYSHSDGTRFCSEEGGLNGRIVVAGLLGPALVAVLAYALFVVTKRGGPRSRWRFVLGIPVALIAAGAQFFAEVGVFAIAPKGCV